VTTGVWSGAGALVDLSIPIRTAMPVFPGDPQVRLAPATTITQDGYNVMSVQMGSQTGTHVDAPYHFEPDGARLEEVPLDQFWGTALVHDVRHVAAGEPILDHHLADDTSTAEPVTVALLWTSWTDRHWGTPEALRHPYLDPAAAQLLLHRGVTMVGIDALSVDPSGHGYCTEAHHVLLGAGAVIVENLVNLGALGVGTATFWALPLPLVDADGAPVRAVALPHERPGSADAAADTGGPP